MVAVLTIGQGTMDADADETWKRGNGMPFANFMMFFLLDGRKLYCHLHVHVYVHP